MKKIMIVLLLLLTAGLYLGPKAYRISKYFIDPVYDGSSETAFLESVKTVSASLSSKERETAKRALMQIGQRMMQTPPRPGEEGLSLTERLYRRLDGKTHEGFMVEYYMTMVDFTEHRLKLAKDTLARLEAAGSADADIDAAKKDVADFQHSRQSWMLKLSRAKAEL